MEEFSKVEKGENIGQLFHKNHNNTRYVLGEVCFILTHLDCATHNIWKREYKFCSSESVYEVNNDFFLSLREYNLRISDFIRRFKNSCLVVSKVPEFGLLILSVGGEI